MGRRGKNGFSLSRFMSGEGGQRFFNIAYSVGAAIVILGALFKILHVKGGDTLLAVGMGTEVLMFILTAFERPVKITDQQSMHQSSHLGNSIASGADYQEYDNGYGSDSALSYHDGDYSASGPGIGNGISFNALSIPPQITTDIEDGLRSMEQSIHSYIEKMEDLNRSIAGLNTIYEIQLKNASSTLNSMEFAGRSLSEMQRMYEGTAERSQMFLDESEKLTENMKKLNEVYENMLRAMNVGK